MRIRKCTWVNNISNVKVGCNSKFVKWQGVMVYYRYCPYCGKAIKWD